MVLTLEPGPGPRYVEYAEASATADWGAMRVRFGDGHPAGADTGPDDFRITINFDSAADQVAYIRGEHTRFGNVLATLLDNNGITEDDVAPPLTGSKCLLREAGRLDPMEKAVTGCRKLSEVASKVKIFD